MKKCYQEPTIKVRLLYVADILTESDSTPKLDRGIGDFYEREFLGVIL